jgi:restriction system protein
MPIPDFQTIMLPLLQHCNDGKEHAMSRTEDELARYFKLTEVELEEMLSSGRQSRFGNRVAWAKQYLTKAELLNSPRRGIFEITDLGKKVLSQSPNRIDINYLDQFPNFKEFRKSTTKNNVSSSIIESQQVQSPREQLEEAYKSIRQSLQEDLLDRLQSPDFHWRRFEILVVDLLVKMGYGGTHKDAGKVTQASKDGGVDGWIKEDKLGLDVIYLQAKKWGPKQSVGRPEIQSFVGALEERQAQKGVFITTSFFSDTAREYVKKISKKVILIDGKDLTELMIDYNIGVSIEEAYEIKRLDSDYFEAG